MAEYTQGQDKLHMCYSFALLTKDHSMTHVRHSMEAIEEALGDGWPCWSIGNHDVERVASRWGSSQENGQEAKIFMIMLLCLRGSICLYQGEELGLTQAELKFDELVDPFGIAFWPEFKGRDGCRTPMPWNDKVNAGFSEHPPLLPISQPHLDLTIDKQSKDNNSILKAYQDFLEIRKKRPEIISGSIKFIHSDEDSLIFIRALGDKETLVALNKSEHLFQYALNFDIVPCALPQSLPCGQYKRSINAHGGIITLFANSVVLAEVVRDHAQSVKYNPQRESIKIHSEIKNQETSDIEEAALLKLKA